MLARLIRLAARALAILLVLTLLGVMTATEAMRPGAAPPAPVDALIVLGAGVEGDGRLAYASRRRTEAAVRLLASGKAEAAILTGGPGQYHPTTPAALLMRDFALSLGADPGRLIVEPLAVSTFENLRFSLALAEARGFSRLALLSDPFHLPRAAALAAWYGHGDIVLVAAPGFATEWWPHRLVTLTREALAWWLNLARVAGWEGLGLIGVPAETRARLIR